MIINDLYTIIDASQAQNTAQKHNETDFSKIENWNAIRKRQELMDLNMEITRLANYGCYVTSTLIRYQDSLNMLLTHGYKIIKRGNLGELVEKSGRAMPWGADPDDVFWVTWSAETKNEEE